MSPKKYRRKAPLLKKSRTGLEVEIHLITDKGKPCYNSLKLIKAVKKEHPEVEILKECGTNVIEFGSYPDNPVHNPAMEILESIEKTRGVAKKNGILLYPFGTYPGSSESKFTQGEDYAIQQKIFGKEKFSTATKVAGFHSHQVLPKGVFDYEKKDVKVLIDSKMKRAMLAGYNFEIAIDPVVTLFTQSSPFVDGKHLAKDSRMLIYRGGTKLKYKGLYSKHQIFGGLPPYKQTATDLMSSLIQRRQKWKRLVKKADPKANFNKLYPSKLSIGWNAVKINPHGTIEQRGMDMTYLSLALATTVLIKFCIKKINREFVEVLPADRGIMKPFQFENNMLFIPPQTYVRKELQYLSAYKGYESDVLYEYAKRFFHFAQSVSNREYKPLIDVIRDQLARKKTVSDEMLQYAKNKGFMKNHRLSDKNAADLALHFSARFEKDMKKTKQLLKKVKEY